MIDTSGVCIEEGHYYGYIHLRTSDFPNRILATECCRNNSITNTKNSADYAVFLTDIPVSKIYKNNNPIFKNPPPKYLCLNRPFVFDHAAIDPDGDSLVYELFTPYIGANWNLVPSSVTYLSPYSFQNPMGGDPLKISKFGILSGKPNTIGRFLIGVRVHEYRNGVYISTSFRDFQFNVRPCIATFAEMPLIGGSYDEKTGIGFHQIQCKSKKIDFKNSSTLSTRYFWRFGDPSTGNQDTSTLFEPSHNYSDTGKFLVTLIAYSANGCSDTFLAYVGVYPTITQGFISNNLCYGDTLKLIDTSKYSRNLPLNTFWKINNTILLNGKTPQIQLYLAGTYTIELINTTSNGCNVSMKKDIIVYPRITKKLNTQNYYCIGENISFHDSSFIDSTNSIVSRKWYVDNNFKSNNNPFTYSFNTIAYFNLKLVYNSDKGCLDSLSRIFYTKTNPVINAFQDDTICYNDTLALHATGGLSYMWYPTNRFKNPNSSNTLLLPGYQFNTEKIYVKGIDSNNCSANDTLSISYFTQSNIVPIQDTSVCLNLFSPNYRDNVLLKASSNFNSYQWIKGDNIQSKYSKQTTVKPILNSEYIVKMKDTFACYYYDTVNVFAYRPSPITIQKDTFKCKEDTLKLVPFNADGFSLYFANPSSGILFNQNKLQIFTTQTTKYYLHFENYCLTLEDSLKVYIPEFKLLDSKIDSVCSGSNYQVKLKGNGKFKWSPNNSISNLNISNPSILTINNDTYFIKIYDSLNCVYYDTLTLIIKPLPIIEISGLKEYICEGDTLKLILKNNPFAIYSWLPDSFIHQMDSLYPYFYPKYSQNYNLNIKAGNGCIVNNQLNLIVKNKKFIQTDSFIAHCHQTKTQLLCSGGNTYRWNPSYNIELPETNHPIIFPVVDTNYQVTATNECFTDSMMIYVKINNGIEVEAGEDVLIQNNEVKILKGNTKGNYHWEPNYFLDNFLVLQPQINPPVTTRYYLISKDSLGCINKDSTMVYVNEDYVLLIPTAFSPNSDGVNDEFGIFKHSNIDKLAFIKIYNKWGNQIFVIQNIDDKWDGNDMKNIKLPLGVYTWHLKATTKSQKEITKSGMVTILQ